MVWFQVGCKQISQYQNIPVKWKCWVSKCEEKKKAVRQSTVSVFLGDLCQQGPYGCPSSFFRNEQSGKYESLLPFLRSLAFLCSCWEQENKLVTQPNGASICPYQQELGYSAYLRKIMQCFLYVFNSDHWLINFLSLWFWTAFTQFLPDNTMQDELTPYLLTEWAFGLN